MNSKLQTALRGGFLLLTAAVIVIASAQQFAAALPWLQAYTSAAWSQRAGLEPPETAWIVECRTEWINRTR